MPCYHPIGAFQLRAGAPLIFSKDTFPIGARHLQVPCGQCVGCRLEYARQWAVRCMCESKMHKLNSFLTLTYDDKNLPADLSLDHSHFVKFFKRLRARLAAVGAPPVSFFMGGEYGKKYSRPHYHAIVFGFYPDDTVFWKESEAGCKVYTSKFLDSVWQLGQVFVGEVTFESASYVARYCLKLEKGKDVSDMREIIDVYSGEVIKREHEYGRMSLRPAIGKRFIDKFGGDVFFNDRVFVRGVSQPLPRYFDVKLQELSPLLSGEVKDKRRLRQELKQLRELELHPDSWKDFERLHVEEKVKLASIKSLRRGD